MNLSSKEIETRLNNFKKVLKSAGLKYTHQRMEIFKELAQSKEHPDADTIYQSVSRRVPAVSIDTVYRTLALLEEAKLINRVQVLSNRVRYDANTERHHHFVCTECGQVRDFHSQQLNDCPVFQSVQDIGIVKSLNVQLRGICLACNDKKNKKQ